MNLEQKIAELESTIAELRECAGQDTIQYLTVDDFLPFAEVMAEALRAAVAMSAQIDAMKNHPILGGLIRSFGAL